MTDREEDEQAEVDPRVPLARQRTDMARERSRWAAERTLMAWVRTAIAMISFGFAIDEVFATLHAQQITSPNAYKSHVVGVTLVLVGILLLVMGSVEHLIIIKRMKKRFGACDGVIAPRVSLPLVGAGIVLLIGIAALLFVML